MASDVAQVAGGPKVPMRYGRKDARDHKDCAVEGNLPGDQPLTVSESCTSAQVHQLVAVHTVMLT